jgi:hypothetical protein
MPPNINVSSYDATINNVKVLDTIQLNATTYNAKYGLFNGLSGVSTYLVAIGHSALSVGTGTGAIGIGYAAGYSGSGAHSVSIGTQAGQNGIGAYSIAIGLQAGLSCDANSIVINASGNPSVTNATNTIVINASSAQLSPATTGCYIAPLRGIAHGIGAGRVFYNTTTKELSYSTD